jgi:oligoendopeptidase F
MATANWNLSPLFKNDADPLINRKTSQVKSAAGKFIQKWGRRSDYLKDPSSLKDALDDYEVWARNFGLGGSVWYYFYLRSQQDQNDPELKAKFNKISEFATKIQNEMQFFTLRIAKIDTKLQKKFLIHKPLSPYKHFLEGLFENAKYLLTEPEEKIMNLKDKPSYANWVKMTSGLITKEEKQILNEKGKKEVKNFSEILGLIDSKNKKVRDKAAQALNEIFLKHLDVSENEINSVLENKKINDELRGFERPDKARHVADDIDSEVIDALTSAVSHKFRVAQDYYKLKARLLKLPKLAYHERNVEYGNIDQKFKYEDSVTLIKKVFTSMDKEFANIFISFVENGLIDVYPNKGKYSGAFAIHNLITQPSYVLLNWTGRFEDVRTLAHEFGHAINFELIRKKQNAINFDTPISVTEVASTFFEDFVLEQMEREANEELKLTLMVKRLNDAVSTIFRQVAFYNFEWELHKEFKEKGYLSKEEIGKIFKKHMESYMGPGVKQNKGSVNWWVYVSHFRYFFYVYSYASGLLISKALQAKLKENPEFITKVKDFLSAGTSTSPKEIFKKLGIDITDKKFWQEGLEEIEILLTETEKLAKKLKKI